MAGRRGGAFHFRLYHTHGLGGLPVDHEKAFAWFEKAAHSNYPKAQLYVGMFWFNGQGVEDSDYDTAAKWIRKAANQKLAQAQYFLGTMYEGRFLL